MGVYIKGMEMPTSCRDCHFEDPYDGYNCRINEKSYNWGIDGRPSDCPLVPAPPHGRLIDADAVYKRLQKQAMSVWGDGNPRYQIVLDVMDAIRFAPTIIPADKEGAK